MSEKESPTLLVLIFVITPIALFGLLKLISNLFSLLSLSDRSAGRVQPANTLGSSCAPSPAFISLLAVLINPFVRSPLAS